MTRIQVHSELHYAVARRCAFAFVVVAQHTDRQMVIDEDLSITGVNDTIAPGIKPISSELLRTSNGIAIAGIRPGTSSCETTSDRFARSTCSTIPRIA